MHVTKRNGNLEPYIPLKQVKAIDWSCQGIDGVDPELVKQHIHSRFIDKMKTSDLHDEHILSAAGLITEDNPNYTYVAARALLQKIYKEVTDGPCHYPHIREYIENALTHDQLNPEVIQKFDLDKLNKHIRPDRDFNFKFQGLKTLYDRYFVRESIKYVKSPKIIELPQHFYMRVAMGLTYVEAEDVRHEKCIEVYDILSTHEFSNGTPTLFNAARTRSQLSSCYLSEVGDDLGSIYDVLKDSAYESKWAGGCGSSWTRVRSAGSPIVGTNGVSNGIVPFLKLYNDTAIAVNQGGKRLGAMAPYLEPWHGDFMDFIELKRTTGEERLRTHEIFPSTWLNDLLLKRAYKKEMWSFFSPYDCPELVDSYGEEFERHYHKYEAEGKFIRQLPADEVWSRILTCLFETSAPWICFKDETNRRNPQKHQGTVHSSNLCFTGDTVVAVADGRNGITIKQLAEESNGKRKFPVYSGTKVSEGKRVIAKRGGGHSELSAWKPEIKNAVAFKTGTRNVVTVVLSNGDTFRCTPDHELGTIEGGFIPAKDSLGVELDPFFTFTGQDRESKYRHIKSLSNADQKQHLMIYAFNNPTEDFLGHIDHIDSEAPVYDHISNLQNLTVEDHRRKTGQSLQGSNNFINKVDPEYLSALRKSQMTGVGNHRFCGLNNYQLIDLLKYECSVRNTTDVGIVYETLQKDGLNLPKSFSNYRFGGGITGWRKFESYVLGELTYGGEYDTPPETPNYEDYYTFKDPERYDYIYQHFIDSSESRFSHKGLTVVSIIDNNEVEDVYDLTVEDNHNFYIITSTDDENYYNCQGVLVHNCTEITLVTHHNEEVAVCNLGSINMAKAPLDPEKERDWIRQTVRIAHRALDNVIDINYYPHDRARNSNVRHRPIGFGVMGYTEYLVARGIDWESEEHLEAADRFFEILSYELISSSVDLAIEKGAYSSFEGSDWSKGILPIHTARTQETVLGMDVWNELAARVAHYGVRNSNHMAIAPTATIGNIIGTTPCIEPVYQRSYQEEVLSGYFTVVDPCLKYNRPELCKYAFDVNPTWVIKAAARRQKWMDQSQSVNIFVPKNITFEEFSSIYYLAWVLGLKSTYYAHIEQTESIQTRQVILDDNYEEDEEPEQFVQTQFSNPQGIVCVGCQ